MTRKITQITTPTVAPAAMRGPFVSLLDCAIGVSLARSDAVLKAADALVVVVMDGVLLLMDASAEGFVAVLVATGSALKDCGGPAPKGIGGSTDTVIVCLAVDEIGAEDEDVDCVLDLLLSEDVETVLALLAEELLVLVADDDATVNKGPVCDCEGASLN